MEVYYAPRIWTTAYEVITLDGSDTPPPKCFPCSLCNECLAQKEFFLRDNRKYCWKCFGKKYGLKCVVCHESIVGVSHVTFIYYDNHAWHRRCFKCSKCRNSLEGCDPCVKGGKCILCRRCGTHVKFESG